MAVSPPCSANGPGLSAHQEKSLPCDWVWRYQQLNTRHQVIHLHAWAGLSCQRMNDSDLK